MDREECIRKLGQMVHGIPFAMLTTVDDDGRLRGRPMANEQVEFDGDLWFVTRGDSTKVHELEQDSRVNVNFAHPETSRFISVSGRAYLLRDPVKARELWTPLFDAWFAKGPDDPNVLLIRVTAERAEYWDIPLGRMVVILNWMKSTVTQPPQAERAHGEKLDLTG